MTASGVAGEVLELAVRRGDGEDQLQSARTDHGLCAAQYPEEVRVAKHALLCLRHEESHRIAAFGYETACRAIDGVRQLACRGEDGYAGLVAHILGSADHAAGRCPRDAGEFGDLFKGWPMGQAGPARLARFGPELVAPVALTARSVGPDSCIWPSVWQNERLRTG